MSTTPPATAPVPSLDGIDRLAVSRAEMARWLDDPASGRAASPLAMPERAARALLSTAAHRHPWGLVAGAAATGAALAVLRPWRWLRPSLLVAVAAPLASDLAGQWLRQALRPAPSRADAAPAADPDPPLA